MNCPSCQHEWTPNSNQIDSLYCPLCRHNMKSIKSDQSNNVHASPQPVKVRLSGYPFTTKVSPKPSNPPTLSFKQYQKQNGAEAKPVEV